jgi:hypothetical protein
MIKIAGKALAKAAAASEEQSIQMLHRQIDKSTMLSHPCTQPYCPGSSWITAVK